MSPPSNIRLEPAASRAQKRGSGTAFLDGLRGLAAFYVLVGHARYVLHEGYQSGYRLHPQDYSAAGKALFYFFSLFRFGHEAVVFFFILSGFVIHLRYARRLSDPAKNHSFGWLDYFIRRVRRLYPPLLLALALTFALDRAGMALGFPIYFGTTPYLMLNETMVPDHHWSTLAGNLAFLMQVYVPAFGTDGPLWSLMYEWWFYMVYPIFWWLSKRSIPLAAAVALGLFLLSGYPSVWPMALPRVVFSMMLIWWMGALLADVYTGRLRVPMLWLAPLALVLPACAALDLPIIVWGVGFAGVIAAGFALQEWGFELTLLNRLRPLGEMSYTLYVCHLPILAFMSGWLMSRSAGGKLPQHFGYLALGIVVAMAWSWSAHLLVERPFTRGRRDAKGSAEALAAGTPS